MRTDTVFVATAVLFNLVVLGINWGVTSASSGGVLPPQNDWLLGLLIFATLLINSFAGRALLTGRDTRRKLLSGLVTMYKDNDVDKYYGASLLNVRTGHGTSYSSPC